MRIQVMLITRKSLVSNIERTKDLNITQEQYDAWQNGMLIQNAMPHLSAEDREFLITGMTQEEWDEFTAEEDDE